MELNREEVARMIWPQLQNAKFKEFYMELLLEKYQKRDRAVNIFIVIATSSSISAWAIFKDERFKWIWAIIVALSQVIILIRPYLNYSRYIKELKEKYYKLQGVNLSYEQLWRNLKFDRITAEDAETKNFEVKKSVNELLNFSDGLIIEEDKYCTDKAKEYLLTYLKLTFNYQKK